MKTAAVAENMSQHKRTILRWLEGSMGLQQVQVIEPLSTLWEPPIREPIYQA